MLSIIFFIFIGCGGGSSHGESKPSVDIDLSDTHAYKKSKYSSILKECIQAKNTFSSCTLDKLPLIGEKSTNITKKMIMDRVIVSHDWMGERFSQMLDILEDDIKYLLGSTTMILIDNNVKPSFYWSLTGAIYIDPRYLWLTPNEAKTIERKEDYRLNYGKELIFENFKRYVKDNDVAYKHYNLDSTKTKTIEDIKYKFARLLYHELGHANDYIPPNMRNQLNKSKKIVNAINDIENELISTKLYDKYPLTSQELKDLGQVLFHGRKASQSQKDTTAKQIGILFSDDTSVAMYGYSNQYEDLAMLLETFLMKYHYDIESDVAFLDKPMKKEKYYCEDYIVKWGKRNLLAQKIRAERALFVVNRILPNIEDWESIDFGETKTLSSEVNWCESVNITQSNSGSKRTKSFKNNQIKIENFKFR